MSCRKIRRSLSRYYRKELSIKEKELIDRHLLTCESCAREAQGYRVLIAAASGLDRLAPSPGFESKLEQKIREVPSTEKESKVKSLFTVFPSLRWAFIPAAAVAVALFLVLKGGFQKSQMISEKPAATSSQESLLVKTAVQSTPDLSSQRIESTLEKESDKTVESSFSKRRRPGHEAVFVMDNLKLSDLEELPDSRIPESRSAYFVIDAVNYRPVDNNQTNVGYVLPAVSTASSKVRKVY